MRKPIRELPFPLNTDAVDNPEQPADLGDLRLQNVQWVEQPSVPSPDSVLHIFYSTTPFAFAGQQFELKGMCSVKVFPGGRTVTKYKWYVPGVENGGLSAQLELDKPEADASVVEAGTDIRRYDPGTEESDIEELEKGSGNRSLPDGIARVLYKDMLNFIQDLSARITIHHTVNRLPDVGTSEEQWNRAFRGMLLERGYENAEGSVQYRKLYEKSK